jgi:hypothetical protein
MARNRALVRASDLSAWAYCHRAWWLANVQGVAHQEPERLQYGSDAHACHGRTVVLAQRLEQLALLILALAALLAVAALLVR